VTNIFYCIFDLLLKLKRFWLKLEAGTGIDEDLSSLVEKEMCVLVMIRLFIFRCYLMCFFCLLFVPVWAVWVLPANIHFFIIYIPFSLLLHRLFFIFAFAILVCPQL